MLYVGKDLPDPGRGARRMDGGGGRSALPRWSTRPAAARSCCARRTRTSTRFSEVLRARTEHDVLRAGRRRHRPADHGRSSRTRRRCSSAPDRSGPASTPPGVACVLVVIDKIPFPVPDEPLHAARRARARARGLDAFVARRLPAAALVLAQGAGRLIRSRNDRGVVAVLDSRLAKRRTGRSSSRRCRRCGAASTSTKRARSSGRLRRRGPTPTSRWRRVWWRRENCGATCRRRSPWRYATWCRVRFARRKPVNAAATKAARPHTCTKREFEPPSRSDGGSVTRPQC